LFLLGDDAGFAGPEVARELGAVASAPLSGITTAEGTDTWAQMVYRVDGTLPDLRPGEHDCVDCLVADRLVIGDASLLRAVGGEAAVEALASGRAILLTDRAVPLTEALFETSDERGETRTLVIPVTAVNIGVDTTLGGLPSAVLPSSLAEDLGLTPTLFATSYVIRLDRQVTELDVGRAGLMLSDLPGTWADAPLGPSRPELAPRLVITIASFLLALGVAAIAVGLGESEAREDQRTLLAVGADPRIRRRIASARAGVLGLLAGFLAVPAGLIPAWGLLASRDVELVIPVAEIALTVLALPLAAIIGALLLSRPIPPWSAFRDVASG
jgi:hypothetical protein